MTEYVEISVARAREIMLAHFEMDFGQWETPVEVLGALGCVQIDPLDPMGNNADMVYAARCEEARRGAFIDGLSGEGFEHFAKERCALPALAWPYYRERAKIVRDWRFTKRMREVEQSVLDAVLEEVQDVGRTSPSSLTDHGALQGATSGVWKSSGKLGTLALSVLAHRCELVACGRNARGERLYDTPERALPEHWDAPTETSFARWALLHRVQACGLMTMASGPQWGALQDVKKSDLLQDLIDEDELVRVRVSGSRRSYIAAPKTLERSPPTLDDRMRFLGPLDPLIWDRKLVEQVFQFRYVWEVYKPADAREFGWYVYPILHDGELVGRIEGKVEGDALLVQNVWEEREGSVDRDALERALERHARVCGVDSVRCHWLED